MITLNLLPKKYRKKIERKETGFSVIGMFILLLIIIALTCELFYATEKLLNNKLETIKAQNNTYNDFFDTERNREIEASVKKINKLMVNIEKIQKNRTEWSKILLDLSEMTPQGIRLYEVRANKADKIIEITGFAQNRDDLLDYEKLIEESDYYESVDLPSSYLINPTDIVFVISAGLTEEALYNSERNN